MTEPLTINRLVHAAVRRDLDRLSRALDEFRDGDLDRARAVALAFGNLRHELTRHHEGEDTYIWPMMAGVGVDPVLLGEMEAEHHAMAEALTGSDAAMSAFGRSGSAADAAAARASVVRTREVVDRHLAHEESELEPELNRYMETPEWKAVEKNSAGSHRVWPGSSSPGSPTG